MFAQVRKSALYGKTHSAYGPLRKTAFCAGECPLRRPSHVAARETLAAWHPSLWDDGNIGRVAVIRDPHGSGQVG